MKKVIGIIVVILMIPVIISVIGDIDRTPIYPTTEFNIIDKPSNKQLLSNDKLLYQLPNTVNFTINELPEYVEYYENGTLEVDSGILNYTVNDNLAYINYIESELTQVVDGELIVSKPTQIISKSSNLFDNNKYVNLNGYELTETGFIRPAGLNITINFDIPTEAEKTYTLSFTRTGPGRVRITDKGTKTIIRSNTTATITTFVAIGDITRITFETSSSGIPDMTEWSYVRLNEGTETLPYEPYRAIYETKLLIDEFLNNYNKESTEYGKVVETGFKNSVNIIKETAEFLKDSIPSKDNILGPIGAVIKRLKELFPSFFMPNPIIK